MPPRPVKLGRACRNTDHWNYQAVRSAKYYLRTSHYSRSGLINQLESAYGEGFTHAQAVYGVNRTGL